MLSLILQKQHWINESLKQMGYLLYISGILKDFFVWSCLLGCHNQPIIPKGTFYPAPDGAIRQSQSLVNNTFMLFKKKIVIKGILGY